MASKDFGSSVSLLQAGGDVIPKEYHRRVLKKIAQLTKVIYALHTKNDEHEEFVAKLRAVHEGEKERLLSDCTARLERCERKLAGDLEASEKSVAGLRESLVVVEKERDDIQQSQVLFRKQAEDQLSSLKSEHTEKLHSVTKQLERLRTEQTQQLKEVGELQERLTKKSSEEIETLRKNHESELCNVREQSKSKLDKLQQEMASLRTAHKRQVDDLQAQFESKLQAQKQNISTAQGELFAAEKKKYEEREALLRDEYSQKEEHLKQQISTLSNELRASKDRSALAEQRIKELESQFEENQVDSSGLKVQLQEAQRKVESLKTTVGSLKNELDIAREQYKQQSSEMHKMSASLGKLEALRVSNEGVVENLRSQIAFLQQKLQQMETERESLQRSQQSSSEEHSVRLRTLERELDKMRHEKQELRAQFAHEIEAAHAQLGQQETHLASEHLKALQELRDQHKEALTEAEREKEQALAELKTTLLSEKEKELQNQHDKFSAELSNIKGQLVDKSAELDLALEELKMLKSQISKGQEHLGSATGEIETLRGEVGRLQRELRVSQRQTEETKEEKQHLKAMVDTLGQQKRDLEHNHQKELKEQREQLKQELDDSWRERLKRECASLRRELSQRHSEDSNAALTELASLKDTAMKQASDQWETEKLTLLDKIEELEKKLSELQNSTTLSLEEARTSSHEEIATLRQKIESERSKHESMLKDLHHSHQEEMLALKQQDKREKETLEVELKQQHTTILSELQQANQIAVSALREEMNKRKEVELRENAERQREEFVTLQTNLVSQHQAELAQQREEYGNEIERQRKQLQNMLEERKKEQLLHGSTVGGLRSEMEGRDLELAKLRDRVNTVTVKVSELKKELEVKGYEVIRIQREANSRIKLREQEMIASHHAELESLHSQYRHKSQLLLTDFNKAKTLLNTKLQDMERELAIWQQRYQSRDSKPEDVQAIRELRVIIRQQEQKMRELVAEKRIYQLELMNREKNYNKLFNANPHIGVLDPLQVKQKKHTPPELPSLRHSSAPSLVSSPASPDLRAPFPTPHHPPVVPPIGSTTQSSTHLPMKEHMQHSTMETKPRKLVMLSDSPLTQQKFSKASKSGTFGDNHSSTLKPIKQKQPQTSSVNSHKHTMVVQ